MSKTISFMYHDFDDKAISKYTLPVSDFDMHIQLMSGYGDVEKLITLDDGHKTDMQAADILESYNLNGIFFIVTSLLGRGRLSAQEVRELYERGHVIGAHTHSHVTPFTKLSYDDMVKEWSESKRILEDIIGSSVNVASIPGGAINSNVFISAKDAGLSDVFTSYPSYRIWNSHGINCHGRICITKTLSIDYIESILNSKHLLYEQSVYFTKLLLKKIVKKEKVKKYSSLLKSSEILNSVKLYFFEGRKCLK